jgi:heme/copper-type cytochrome/quinol oxidase subunit 2
MEKIFGAIKLSKITVLKITFVAFVITTSFLSLLVGFYIPASLVQIYAYPELQLSTLESLHTKLYYNLLLAMAIIVPTVTILGYIFSRNYIKQLQK